MYMPSASGQHLQSNSQVHMNTVCMPKFIRQHTNTVSHLVLCTHTHTHTPSPPSSLKVWRWAAGSKSDRWPSQLGFNISDREHTTTHACMQANTQPTYTHARTRKHRHLKVFLKQTHPQSKRRSSAHLTSRQSHKQHCTCIVYFQETLTDTLIPLKKRCVFKTNWIN